MTSVQELSEAVWKGDQAAVERLIAAGVDVNAADEPRMPPLHLAIEQQWVGIVERLIAAGADVNRIIEGGWTALVHAIDIESDAASQAGIAPADIPTTLTELLLRAGAIPDDEAFGIAGRYGNEDAIRLLKRYQARM